VVQATVKAYPNEPITATDFVVGSTAYNSDGLLDAYTYFASQMPAIVKKGISGYFYLVSMGIDGPWTRIGLTMGSGI
jgi:hypothetical protein